MCFDFPLQEWFDFKVPKTSLHPQYIQKALAHYVEFEPKPSSKMVWIGTKTELKSKQIKGGHLGQISLHSNRETTSIELALPLAEWLMKWLDKAHVSNKKLCLYGEVQSDFETQNLGTFNTFWHSDSMAELRRMGLLVL
jgi:hypothetical protein